MLANAVIQNYIIYKQKDREANKKKKREILSWNRRKVKPSFRDPVRVRRKKGKRAEGERERRERGKRKKKKRRNAAETPSVGEKKRIGNYP